VPSRTNGLDGKVALAGVGYSQIARRTGRSEGSLAVEACKNALADAGLTIDDVDGISVWPDRISSAFEGPSIAYMHRALGMKNTRFWQAYGAGPAQLSSMHILRSGRAFPVQQTDHRADSEQERAQHLRTLRAAHRRRTPNFLRRSDRRAPGIRKPVQEIDSHAGREGFSRVTV